MSVVVDASVAIAWALPDERNAFADSVMAQAIKDGGFVPGIWLLEIGNILIVSVRRGRLTWEEIFAILADFQALPLEIDSMSRARGMVDTLELAREYKLSVYDAAYLELAIRKSAPLATLDKKLEKASRATGLPQP